MFGTRASLFVDLFLLALIVILPATFVAVALVRRGKVKAHATVMTTCFWLFVLSVVAFEIDVHLGGRTARLARLPLVVHLCFAIPCLLVWVRQVLSGRGAPANLAPHRKRGRILIGLMTATVGTGIWLYVVTFA